MADFLRLQFLGNSRLHFFSRLSREPWMVEKRPFFLVSVTQSVYTAAIFLMFLAPVSLDLSRTMQSPTSKSLQGKGIDLFSTIVRSSPGNRVVRPVWNYFVLASSIVISKESSLLKILVVRSALQHSVKFNASLNWACAISCLRKSENLLILSCPPMVDEGGKVGVILGQPQQMAMSSRISHSCRTSTLQKGTSTLQVPSSLGVAFIPVLFKYPTICSAVSEAPIMFSAFLCEMVNSLCSMVGVINLDSPSMISTGSTSKLGEQNSLKDQIMVAKQIMALGLLRAVTSMNTFLVSIDILDLSELMIGGTEQTLSSLSSTRGQTGLSLIKGRYYLSLSFSSRAIMPWPSTSWVCLRGINLKSLGSLATYLNGPLILSRS